MKNACALFFLVLIASTFEYIDARFKLTTSHLNTNIIAKNTAKALTSAFLFCSPPLLVDAKEELPSLEKCFNAVRKELKPGESLVRLKNDIEKENWDDLKIFTREYDAGFRGGVLKSAWKQLGDKKQQGISITNSFTFDLIALNKAARNQDKDGARVLLGQIQQDLTDFLALEPK